MEEREAEENEQEESDKEEQLGENKGELDEGNKKKVCDSYSSISILDVCDITCILPYSGQFSLGANFRGQTCFRENINRDKMNQGGGLMTSLCDTNWYPCKRDGSLQSAAEETQPATVYTKYQPTRKKPSEVVEFEISSAESFRSTNQFLARAAACSLDTFVSGIGLHAKGRVGRCCTRLLRFVVQCHSFG